MLEKIWNLGVSSLQKKTLWCCRCGFYRHSMDFDYFTTFYFFYLCRIIYITYTQRVLRTHSIKSNELHNLCIPVNASSPTPFLCLWQWFERFIIDQCCVQAYKKIVVFLLVTWNNMKKKNSLPKWSKLFFLYILLSWMIFFRWAYFYP